MSKRLLILLALVFVAGFVVAANAEVQNVKVSGDITIMAVNRNDFDLFKDPTNDLAVSSTLYTDHERDFLSITRVRVDADLTDNVTTTVRLLNERNWNGDSATVGDTNTNIGYFGGLGQPGTASSEQGIDIDLAYVTLKEFLYSPLTLRVGRQELHFNNDFIIGDPDTNIAATRTSLAEGDLSARKAFDAIRATLDYNPLVVDIFYAKLDESNSLLNDDVTLSGINAAYELDKNTLLEGYFYSKTRGTNAAAFNNLDGATLAQLTDNNTKRESVFTVGGRVVNKTVKNLSLDLQSAFQFGNYNPKYDTNAYFGGVSPTPTTYAGEGHRRAWALEAILGYDLKDAYEKTAKYNPYITATYIYLSGDDRQRTNEDTYRAWDPVCENQTLGHITNAIFGFSNVHVGGLALQAKPMEDITMKFQGEWLWFAKRYPDMSLAVLSGVPGARAFTMAKNPFIGQEYDLTLTYDYTEDVQFSVLGGLFIPSSSITGDIKPGFTHLRQSASELIGSMKVTF